MRSALPSALLALPLALFLPVHAFSGIAQKKVPPKKTVPAVNTPAWTELPHAVAGKDYSQPMHLVVGPSTTTPLTFVAGGGVPACLKLSTQGVLSGKPDTACTGTYRFSVFLTGDNGEQSSATFLLHIDTTATAPSGGAANASQDGDSPEDKGTDTTGNVNIEVDGASKKVSVSATLGGAAKPGSSKPTAAKDPDCGLLITSVLADGATQIKGSVNKDVVDADSLIGFCRSRSGEPRTCMVGDGDVVERTLFEPLDGASDSYFVPPDTNLKTFSAKLLVPLDYGDSLNAVLVKYKKKCQEMPFGVVQETKDSPDTSSGTKAIGGQAVNKQNSTSGDNTDKNVKANSGSGGADTTTPDTASTHTSTTLPTSAAVPVLAYNSLEKNSNNPPHRQADSLLPVSAPSSPMIPVEPGPDWGRIRATFVLGIVLANDTSQLSSAHQFYDMLVEKYWSLPGCYRPRYGVGAGADENKQCLDDADHFVPKNRLSRHSPGVNTYFETRLTAIPISSVPSTSATGSSTTSAGTTGTGTTSSTTANTGGTFLTTQKTARVGVGVDLPFLVTRWDWRHRPNALFLAPLAKTGFDTLAGSQNQTVVAPDGGTTTASYERLYNYYAFGGRLGHYTLSHSQNSAPEWQSFLDVVVGRFSNLQSYICEPAARKPGFATLPNSQCGSAYGPTAATDVDSLKRPYRLDFEGALKVPYIPILIGFNANLGQHAISTGHVDPAYNTPDDLRFLFGTKFDVAAFVTKLGLPQLGK